MNCVVTAGPTFEAFDEVRRLTNFSTGRLGTELANFLTERGYAVRLLLGEQATYDGPRHAQHIERYTNAANLMEKLQALARSDISAVFHAAAVSDFGFGKIWVRSPSGELSEIKSRKISTRSGSLLAELVPTPKIITRLRTWYPQARLVGWKFEVDGDRTSALQAAERQLRECRTDACVVNGLAFGAGFGLVTGAGRCRPLAARSELFAALVELLAAA